MIRRRAHRDKEQQMVLLTRDMIMACTASAENIDTFYLSPGMPERFSFNNFNISKIITELATTFGEIRIEGLVDDYSIHVQGMWSGKDIVDWQKGILRWATVAHGKEPEKLDK